VQSESIRFVGLPDERPPSTSQSLTALTSIVLKGAALGVLIGLGCVVYLATSWALGSEEMRLLRSVMRPRGRAA
jgi:hypothetical protein